jgi:hypothetical protein
MSEHFFRYKPEEGVEETPNHIYSEGIDLDASEYAHSLLRSAFVSHFSRTFGKYDSGTGMIFIDEDAPLSEKTIREHELIHKLLHLYREPDYSQKSGTFPPEFQTNNLDHVDISQDEELADKYNVDPKVTTAVISDRYERFMAELGYQETSGDMMMASDEEIRGHAVDIERTASNQVDEILTHYLSPHSNPEEMDFYGFTEEETRKAARGIMALDKDCDFDRLELIERFATFEDFEDFMEQTKDLDLVNKSELNKLNGYMRAKDKSLKQLAKETLGF